MDEAEERPVVAVGNIFNTCEMLFGLLHNEQIAIVIDWEQFDAARLEEESETC